MSLNIMFAVSVLIIFLAWPLQASGESCIECHLHQSIVKDFASAATEAETLAGLHGREFGDKETVSGCKKCHGNRQNAGKLPDGKVCIGCHSWSRTAQGKKEKIFHAEKAHWPVGKVSCTECHKGHVKGNPDARFLTIDVIGVCSRCHEKSFKGY